MNKKSWFTFLLLAISLLGALSTLLLVYNLGRMASASQTAASASGQVQVEVLEANTNKPIDGATVCIIETMHYENTNRHGKTEQIAVPILKNAAFDLSLERTWGELTILVYKNGYKDHISFYTSVLPNSTRVGVVIHLSPIISASDTAPEISVEYPKRTWAESLIKLYKKRV